jgi:hypothetical protein
LVLQDLLEVVVSMEEAHSSIEVMAHEFLKEQPVEGEITPLSSFDL